jgi:hypothetical protein
MNPMMLSAIRAVIAGCMVLIILTLIGVFTGVLSSCARPPRTAAEAETCRTRVDRQFLPPLVQEALGNCPHGGRAEYCVSAGTIEAYQAALDACRESK